MLFRRSDPNAQKVFELQEDFKRTFSTPEGRRVFAHLALMWGHFGGKMDGMRPEYHDAFLWILDAMGLNHIDNVQDLADALRGVRSVTPRRETLAPEGLILEDESDDIGNWRRAGA
jgi:hypothetical protein